MLRMKLFVGSKYFWLKNFNQTKVGRNISCSPTYVKIVDLNKCHFGDVGSATEVHTIVNSYSVDIKVFKKHGFKKPKICIENM